jgi:hypothetical protein
MRALAFDDGVGRHGGGVQHGFDAIEAEPALAENRVDADQDGVRRRLRRARNLQKPGPAMSKAR